MDILIKEIMLSPTVTKVMLAITLLLLSGLILLIIWGGKYFLKFMQKQYSKFEQEIKIINFKIDATDHALGKHFDNGYQDIRDKKFNELKDNDNFINE